MNQQQKGIHYFPGHMAKALRNLGQLSSFCDILVEIADARAPLSSRNPLLAKISPEKPRLILLNKDDLADPLITQKWLAWFKNKGIPASVMVANSRNVLKLLKPSLGPLEAKKRAKEAKYGMKRQPLKLAVFGIPNVGKSTFINSLAGRKAAKAANRPGVTVNQQWVNVSGDVILLDTPGILPMNYEDPEVAKNLALLGSIREEVLPAHVLGEKLLAFLSEHYPEALTARFGPMEGDNPLEHIARRRGLLLPGGEPDIERANSLLLREFRDGFLGRFSLEQPDA